MHVRAARHALLGVGVEPTASAQGIRRARTGSRSGSKLELVASGTGAKRSQRTVRWLVRAEPVRSPLTLPPHALRRAVHRERSRAFLTKYNFLNGLADAG